MYVLHYWLRAPGLRLGTLPVRAVLAVLIFDIYVVSASTVQWHDVLGWLVIWLVVLDRK